MTVFARLESSSQVMEISNVVSASMNASNATCNKLEFSTCRPLTTSPKPSLHQVSVVLTKVPERRFCQYWRDVTSGDLSDAIPDSLLPRDIDFPFRKSHSHITVEDCNRAGTHPFEEIISSTSSAHLQFSGYDSPWEIIADSRATTGPLFYE